MIHDAPQDITSPAAPAMQRPEILAPAGNEEMMRAAIENGADAVYFGLQQFNARLRAHNFTTDELPRIMAMLHERGMKGYVVMNTLVFVDELEAAAECLRACSAAGVDAVLVQDLGLAALASRLVPDLSVHASTQMTLTSAESIARAAEMGLRLDRVVAPRELSIKELRALRKATTHDIEVFVHGALCVAYSGQCLTSEALGGRSANRGECAQACRLPYDLVVDGQPFDMGDIKYVLSPKDLAAYEDIGELMRLGIVSLKIEGRLKSPHYVAATVQSYRAAIDSVVDADDPTNADPRLDEPTRRKLEMTFSRGFTGGYVHAIDHQAVVEGRFPKKRGLALGHVTGLSRRGVRVALEGPVRPGDGVVFDAGTPDREEEGGRVHLVLRNGERVEAFEPADERKLPVECELTFGDGAIDPRRIRIGDRVWKTSDPQLDAQLAASWSGDRIHHRRPVRAIVRGAVDAPLVVRLEDEDGLVGEAIDTAPAEAARKHSLDEARLREQLGRLGNTPFELAELRAEIDGAIMVPMSRLNDLRRVAVDQLVARRRALHRGRHENVGALTHWRAEPANDSEPPADIELSALCRTLDQVEAAAAHYGVTTLYVDFENPRTYAEARRVVPHGSRVKLAPATLRVFKPGEAGFVRTLLAAEPDAVLVRNLAAWQVLRRERPGLPLIGDYALNVANDLTARLLKGEGLAWLTPSYDLNADQLMQLLRATPPSWYEVTIHQYMPMFHMEHCVFCRYLSTGTDHTNCGRPCESHTLALRDRVGYEHLVKADAGCRNTVFNAVAQSASEYLAMFLGAGVRRFRVDFLAEKPAQVHDALDAYHDAITGREDGRALWRRLKARSKLGVTRGTLDNE